MDRGMDGMPAYNCAAYSAPAGSAIRASFAGMTKMVIAGHGLRPAATNCVIDRGTWTATEPAMRDTGSALRRRRTAVPGRDTARGLRPAAVVPRNVTWRSC